MLLFVEIYQNSKVMDFQTRLIGWSTNPNYSSSWSPIKLPSSSIGIKHCKFMLKIYLVPYINNRKCCLCTAYCAVFYCTVDLQPWSFGRATVNLQPIPSIYSKLVYLNGIDQLWSTDLPPPAPSHSNSAVLSSIFQHDYIAYCKHQMNGLRGRPNQGVQVFLL